MLGLQGLGCLLLLRERGNILLWDRSQLRLVIVLLWLRCVSTKPSPSWHGLKWLRLRLRLMWLLLLSKGVVGALGLIRRPELVWLSIASWLCLLLGRLRLLLEASLLRVELLLLLLRWSLLEPSLLVLHWHLLPHLLLVLLDRVKEVNQVHGGGLGLLRLAVRIGWRAILHRGRLFGVRHCRRLHTWWDRNAFFGQVFPPPEVKVRVVQIIF